MCSAAFQHYESTQAYCKPQIHDSVIKHGAATLYFRYCMVEIFASGIELRPFYK